MNSTSSKSLLQAAVRYASFFGIPVFPVWGLRDGHCACWKGAACERPAKHPIPGKGLLSATTDIDQIEEWWRRCPLANIGARTGLASSLVVIDIDPRHGGDDALAMLEREQGSLPDTPEVATGGGGRHLYLRHPGRPAVKNSTSKLGPGLDIRGDGGYIIAPPSLHISGGRYDWDVVLSLEEIDPAPVPPWMLELLADTPSGSAAEGAPKTGGYAYELLKAQIPEGTRNDAMFRIACRYRQLVSHNEVLVLMLAVNDGRCVPPLLEHEVEGLVDQAFGYSQRGVNGHPKAIINRWKETKKIEDV